uniref:Integral-membrane protein n=1 Tax=Streptomyces sp. NBC_00049 TaxID=2903617 RepID=A0AAU2JHP4_9ACTN
MFAALCVLLAATGHLLMSGRAVPWWAVSAAFAAAVGTAWVCAGRERGPRAVVTAAVAVQAALHAGFSLAQSVVHPSLPAGTSFARQWGEYLVCGDGATSALPAAAAGLAGPVVRPPSGTVLSEGAAHGHHAMHGMHEMAGAASAAPAMPGGGHDMGGMSPAAMLAAHLLAAVLCGLWLAYGERAFFRILRAVAGWLRAPLRLFLRPIETPHPPRVLLRRARRRRAPRRLLLVHAITSRGPPAGTAVV